MGFLIYNLFTISSADSMKLLEPDRFDPKEKQTEKKNNPRKRSVSYLLIWSAYNLNHKMIKFPERSEVCLFSMQ